MPQPIATAIRQLIDVVSDAVSPRGRCVRRGLLVMATALLAVQVVDVAATVWLDAGPDAPAQLAVTAALLWLSTTAVAKRLHDLDLPASRLAWAALGVVLWSVVLSLALMLALGIEALEPGQLGHWAVIVGSMLPVFVLTLWLHVTPGTPGPNRHGAAPGPSGFSMPAGARPAEEAQDAVAVAG